jgi:rhamnosyltransferase
MTPHILCAMRNAAPFIEATIASVQAQTHRDWIMLLRDDGSTDGSAAIVERLAREDARIRLAQRSATAIGAAAGYHALLQLVPDDADVACVDADDLWTPEHLARSLAALGDAGPALVHGDLEVIDSEGRTLQPSFWRARGTITEPATVQRLAVDNVVTGSTIVMNAALARIIRARPIAGAVFQDSWFALAAAAAGRIVARRDITVRYRQHAANTVGAQVRTAVDAINALPLAAKALANRARFRRDLARTAAQAGAFALAFGDLVSERDRTFLQDYAALPHRPWPTRALGVFSMRSYPGRSTLSAIGEALRC